MNIMISKHKSAARCRGIFCVSWSASLLACALTAVIFMISQAFGAIPAGNSDSTVAQKNNEKISPKVKEYMERLDKLLSPIAYTYSPAGKPDPFQPFIRNNSAARRTKQARNRQKTKPAQCTTPLQCMDVGQLRLVAIIIGDDGKNLAMAQDASGIGYILKPSTPVGYRNGHVKAILPDRVVIEEESEDIRGDVVLAQRVLLLHPEEQ